MKIAIDVMGGDYAPRSPIEGAKLAHETLGDLVEFYLVGEEETIKKFSLPQGFNIVDAQQVIEPHEPPMEAYRKKKDSSISIAIDLQKEGEADGRGDRGDS